MRSNSGGQMPVTNSRSSVEIGLDRRQLRTDLLKLFETLLQQVFVHDCLLYVIITILPYSAAEYAIIHTVNRLATPKARLE